MDETGTGRNGAAPPRPKPQTDVEAAAYIAEMARTMIGLAAGDGFRSLRYLLSMVEIEAKRVRKEGGR